MPHECFRFDIPVQFVVHVGGLNVLFYTNKPLT